MKVNDFPEKRSHLRYDISIDGGYSDYFTHRYAATITENICEDGLCISTQRLLLPGTEIDVVLVLGDTGEEVSRHGKVAWCRIVAPEAYRAGIHLEEARIKPIEMVLRTIKAQRHY